jgi:phosphatidylserine decarboxylase
VRLTDKAFTALQYPLPHHLLSALVRGLTRIRFRPVKNLLIAVIGGIAGVDWSEARRQEYRDYAHFNDFFTRELQDGARPVDPDPDVLVSPSDGRVSASGRITSGRILQAKGHHYTVRSLLADDPASAEFLNGFFHTIYLSPRDYHRVHMPLAGKLQRMVHVPGRAFSVSPGTVRELPGVFARNERVVSLFETPHGPMALVLVGAMLVSSMDTVWAGTVNPPRARRVERTDWSRRDIRLDKGAEMGRFNMGSTVIVLLPPEAVAALDEQEPGDPVLMGQRLGRLR